MSRFQHIFRIKFSKYIFAILFLILIFSSILVTTYWRLKYTPKLSSNYHSKHNLPRRANETYFQNDLFDPNLTKLRQSVKRILDSSMFLHGPLFRNPFALYTESRMYVNTLQDRDDIRFKGSLNIYIWSRYCAPFVDQLKNLPGFPFNPVEKKHANGFPISHGISEYGQRVFGYIVPPITGEYSFALSSSGGSEFWLSTNSDPNFSIKLAYVCSYLEHEEYCFTPLNHFRKFTSQISPKVHLIADQYYYIEVLSATLNAPDYLQLMWLPPSFPSYKSIPKECLALYVVDLTPNIPESYHSNDHYPMHKIIEKTKITDFNMERDKLYTYPLVKRDLYKHVFPSCNYIPNYALQRSSDKFSLRLLSVYPNDHTNTMNEDDASPGNSVISDKEAKKILDFFLFYIRQIFPNLKLIKLTHMEKLSDISARYLLDVLVIIDCTVSMEIEHISEYVVHYMPSGENELCIPKPMQIKSDAFVHVMVGVKNMGRWVRDFIENMERIYEQTHDEHFSVIIVDFESTDIDIEVLLRQSSLKHWKLVEVKGKFLRAGGINIAIDLLSEKREDIFFTCDLTLGLPNNMIEDVRKHTFQGYSGYAPIFLRKMCNYLGLEPFGYWEIMGYGMISLYISDYISIGGLDSITYQDSWGGEDWNLADKILRNGLVLDRIKKRHFYHYYHVKYGLWGK